MIPLFAFGAADISPARWPTPGRRDDPIPASLTPRERQIAASIAMGHSNRTIAERLRLSEKTVRNQSTVLFEKCGVKGRLQLALFITRHPELLDDAR